MADKSGTRKLTIGGKTYNIKTGGTPKTNPAAIKYSAPSYSPSKVQTSPNTQKVSGSVGAVIAKAGTGVTKVTGTPSPTIVSPTNNNVYASTQNVRKSQIYSNDSQNPVNVATADSNKAQPKYFTLATNASGQSYTIPSGLSLQARQYYAKLGIATTSIKNPAYAGESKQDVMIDERFISGIDTPYQILCQTGYVQKGFGCQPEAPVLGDPVKNSFDNDLPKVITKEENPVANDVQLTANNYDTTGVNQANADYNYNLGQSLYNPNSSDPLDILSGQTMTDPFQQWMSQQNQNIVPTNAYGAFTQNGNGSQSLDAGVSNIKNTFGSIMQSKWFPFAIIGLVGIIVLSMFRGKSGGQAPTVVRYG